MKDEDVDEFFEGKRLEGGIRTAADLWCTDPAAAKAQYGPIASWNTSEIRNMNYLFWDKAGFNEDISRWDVSNVSSLLSTFNGACLLYTSPSPRDQRGSRMPSSA